MTKVECPACGQANDIPGCRSCEAELAIAPNRVIRIPEFIELDQTSSERDQTASDDDQTWADRDQTASDQDQRSSDEDQTASDEDVKAGGDIATHRHTTDARERSTEDRHAASALRDENASRRVVTAEDRDRAAERRDHGAEIRDVVATLTDLEDDSTLNREDILLRAARDRARAASDRAKAAHDRARAAEDRREAARDRAESMRSRMETAEEIKSASTDELTGARMRQTGLEEISREIERAHRTGGSLVAAFVDIDGLKQVNDKKGHLAGDALLQLTGETLRANLRPYDVIVRYGGDEFICAMPNLDRGEARTRFEQIADALASVDSGHSVSFGLALAEPTDTLRELIAKADADLLETRRGRRKH